MATIYDYLSQDLYSLDNQDTASVSTIQQTQSVGSETYSDTLISGEIDGNLSFTGGFIQSYNFVSGSAGWRLSANGTLEAVNAILSGTIDIGGSDATSFHVDVDGNMWLGAATYASASAKISNAGVLIATSGSIGGFTIGATTITGGTLVLDSVGTIKTASSGQRVEINTQTLILYDSGAEVIKLGTASASEGNTTAVKLSLNTNTLAGIQIDSATDATLGIRIDSSSNITMNALRIALTNIGTGNDGYGIYVQNLGTATSSHCIDIDKAGVGNGIRLFSTSSSSAVELNVSTNTGASALNVRGNSSNRTAALVYIDDLSTAGPGLRIESDYTTALDIINNNANIGAVQIVTSVNSGNNAIGMRMSITNAGAGIEYAFEFAGSEYDGAKTGVSGLTGVIKVLTASDGLVYIPCYGTAT